MRARHAARQPTQKPHKRRLLGHARDVSGRSEALRYSVDVAWHDVARGQQGRLACDERVARGGVDVEHEQVGELGGWGSGEGVCEVKWQ